MLIKGGTILILLGSLLAAFRVSLHKAVYLLGAVVTIAGLCENAVLSDGFYPSLVISKTFLLAPLWALFAVYLSKIEAREGEAEQFVSRAVVPGILFVSIMALLYELPGQSLSVKVTSISATLFFLTEVLSNILFGSASLIAILCLIKNRKLPEPLMGTILLGGFIVFSFCQLAGAWWAWMGWAVPFHWSHRHLIGAAVWCAYAAALHLRFTSWSNKTRAWILAVSIFPLVFPWYFRARDLIEALLTGGHR